MARDRTLDLKPADASGQSTSSAPPMKSVKDSKKGAYNQEGNDTADAMKDFFAEIGAIKETVALIKNSIAEIKSLHDRALNSVISEQENAQIAKSLEAAMDRTNQLASEVRGKLKEMDNTNKKLKKQNNSSDVNIRISQHGVLTKNFLDLMMDYKNLQELYQGKYKDRMQRQALVVNPSATAEEVEKIIEGGNSQQIFSGQIMHSGQRNEAKRALQDIQSKHQDVLRIEKSIIELQQLFMDLSVLLVAQGEMVDQIALHVTNAVEDTEEGVKELTQAVKLQKRTRKRMCMIIGGIIALIAVVGLIAYFTTKK